MQSKFIEINQNKYFVRTWGTPNNPKILLLHGFPEYSGAWEPLADHLKKDFYLIAPDQRGFGQSWGPLDEKFYKTASIINDLEALIKYYGKESGRCFTDIRTDTTILSTRLYSVY